METIFNSTADFERDMQNLEAAVRAHLIQHINDVARDFVQDKAAFARQARRPYPVNLSNGYGSSLYVIRVGPKMRLIAAFDEDPIFDRVIVTLLRAVEKHSPKPAFDGAAASLYGSLNGHFTQLKAESGAKVG